MPNRLLWRTVLSLLIFCLITGVLPGESLFFSLDTSDRVIEKYLAAMSDEELLGHIFFLGYQGKTVPDSLLEWIKKRNLGGVKIFTRNVSSLAKLSADIRLLQRTALDSVQRIPLLIATDQEGGWVRHIRSGTSDTPGNMALGASPLADDTYWTGYYLGMELRLLGINMNFAPTVDVYAYPATEVIGPRAFSADPVKTGMLAVAYFKGMEQAGIICTAKHYPGHGSADKDSHGWLPVVDLDYEQLWVKDLVPYRFLIKEGIPAIMGGHLSFPRIIEKELPATLSPFFLKEVLRGRLQFKGLIITDDMEMYGIHQGWENIPRVAKEAVEAGNDMLLISHTTAVQEQVWNYLLKSLKLIPEFKLSLKQAVRRILQVKLKYLKAFPLLPEPDTVEKSIPVAGAREFFFQSACRAVTLLKSKNIPYIPSRSEKILLIGQVEQFFKAARSYLPQAATLEFDYAPIEFSSSTDRARALEAAAGYDRIIFCLLNENSREVLEALHAYQSKIIVISALTPVYLAQVPWVETALAVYGISLDSFRAGFAVLLGEYVPEGSLPFFVPELTDH